MLVFQTIKKKSNSTEESGRVCNYSISFPFHNNTYYGMHKFLTGNQNAI